MEDHFLSNQSKVTFLQKLSEGLTTCKEFYFSVSFIKYAGLELLLKSFLTALNRGVKGHIITSTYQNFTDILSLQKFYHLSQEYSNFEVHLDYNDFDDCGFHTKGYLFVNEDSYEVIIGSSNITRYALLKNKEWDLSLYSKNASKSYLDSYQEFQLFWKVTSPLTQELIEQYKSQLEYAIERWDMDDITVTDSIKPNYMQKKALKEIARYRQMGCKKALVVAATASGKTYLAAFDAFAFGAKHLLFIVQKDTILQAAKNTFQKIFGNSFSYGFYTGTDKDLGADFIFATNIMISKDLSVFSPEEFDYLVLDECHHATSETYQKILAYFKPAFCLGLTATPERMDNEDVFQLFDNNVPYELRLRDALMNDLIVPFHYYGVRNQLVDYSDKEQNAFVHQMVAEENIHFIQEQIEAHRTKDQKLKCLAFCKTIDHARKMSEQMNELGYHTNYLTGSNLTRERMDAFKRLQDDKDSLEILFTVDILNEGVDIPAVNMVLFLRPTESSTVFIQQLGRGLRKYPNKEYVTVLDFIGNSYERSVQIAFALGSLTQNNIMEKRLLMDMIETDFVSLDLPVVIHFDPLSKEEILSYVENTNFNTIRFLESDYFNFKKYLHLETYPSHMDYFNCDFAPDLMRFMKSKINGKKNMSYYSFLKKVDPSVVPSFTSEEENFINSLSDLLPLVRMEEYVIVRDLLKSKELKNISEDLKRNDSKYTDEIFKHACLILKKKNLLDEENHLVVSNKNSSFVDFTFDLIEYGLTRFAVEFGDYIGKFKNYSNYYKEQIMMILQKSSLSFMKGTLFEENGSTYIFVGLKKDKTKEENLNYKDKFLSSNVFQWESENNTTLDNSTGIKIQATKKVYLFVRKMDDEDGITLPFTYFGCGSFANLRQSKNNGVDTLTLDVLLDDKVPEYLHRDFQIPEDNHEENN